MNCVNDFHATSLIRLAVSLFYVFLVGSSCCFVAAFPALLEVVMRPVEIDPTVDTDFDDRSTPILFFLDMIFEQLHVILSNRRGEQLAKISEVVM